VIKVFSSWPYVSGSLHLGRLIGSFIPADCYSRLLTKNNISNHHYSGLDCYGQKKIENLEKVIEKTKKEHEEIFRKMSLIVTYGTTNSEGFVNYCQKNLLRLKKEQIIREEVVSFPYCSYCKKEERTSKNELCIICNSKIVEIREKRNILFPLIQKENSRNNYEEVERASTTPGLASPFSLNKKIWVWIQALQGYQYISKEDSSKLEVYFYGCDNEYFHKGILPLLAETNLIQRKHIVSKYLLVDEKKMSGSKDNYLTITEFKNEESLLRLYLLSFNLKKRNKNFRLSCYYQYKKWIHKKLTPILLLIDKEKERYQNLQNEYLKLLSIYENNRTFSFLYLILQKKISENTYEARRIIFSLLEILSPGLL